MLIGYARVSTDDQDFALQEDALNKAGCKKIFYDKMSGAKSQRPGLQEAMDYLRDGEDTLVVWRLDRLGRSLKDLIDMMNQLEGRGIGFQSLQESIDTTTSGGRLIFHIFGALAEFERNLIRERTKPAWRPPEPGARKGDAAARWTKPDASVSISSTMRPTPMAARSTPSKRFAR
jgi:DNA invertase Pin-like site-specific DNA recombinase